MTNEQIWIAFGLTGQLLFTARFVVQWLSSEREKRSVVPPSFWYFSIGGALMLLIYAICVVLARRDDVEAKRAAEIAGLDGNGGKGS